MGAAGREPLLVTAGEASRLRRIMARVFRGGGGIAVNQTDDAVSITLAKREQHQAGGGGESDFYLVKLSPGAGTSGGPDTECSYTYVLYPREATYTGGSWDTDPISGQIQPVYRPTTYGRYVQAPVNTFGIAYYNNGAWRLAMALRERLATTVCNPA